MAFQNCFKRGLLSVRGRFSQGPMAALMVLVILGVASLRELRALPSVLPIGTLPHLSTPDLSTIVSSALERVMKNEKIQSEALRELYSHFGTRDDHNVKPLNLTEEAERCARYGYMLPSPPLKKKRRIFWGSLIADDSWHAIGITALEGFGMYHTVALVESNRTQSREPRDLRFSRDDSLGLGLLQSGIFGRHTKVSVDIFTSENEELKELDFERVQRHQIVERWRQNGMRPDVVGISGDMDESFTRDFLQVLQTCDIPQLRPGQTCEEPKLLASTLVTETSPDCITSNRRWHHPDAILGECILGIGDDTGRPVPARQWNEFGLRADGHQSHDYRDKNATLYPLYSGADIREAEGASKQEMGRQGEPTGYHHHNYFMSIDSVRFKYRTYTHPHDWKQTVPMEEEIEDLALFVRCVKGKSDVDGNWEYSYVPGAWKKETGPIPLAFESASYRKLRHEEATKIVHDDEVLVKRARVALNESPQQAF